MSLSGFFLWLCVDTHPRSFVGFYPTMSFIFNNLEPFLGCIPPLVNCIPCFVNHALLSSLCYLLLKFVVYVPRRPWWVGHMLFFKLCEPGNHYGSYSTSVMSDKISTHNFVEGEKWMKGYALKKWESTLNFVFMPMDPMYIFSSKLLLKLIIPLI